MKNKRKQKYRKLNENRLSWSAKIVERAQIENKKIKKKEEKEWKKNI